MDKDSISSIGGQSPVVIKKMRTEESLQQLADSVHPKQRSPIECISPRYVGVCIHYMCTCIMCVCVCGTLPVCL